MESILRDFPFKIDEKKKTVRKLSDMKGFYEDQGLVEEMLSRNEDPIIYEVYACENEGEGELSYAVTVINPGTVGREFYMTKGHFHVKPAGEVYLTLEGKGTMVLMDRAGNTTKKELRCGEITYVPAEFAHRTVNTGDEELVFLAIYETDAGHDYSTIEKSGFNLRVRT